MTDDGRQQERMGWWALAGRHLLQPVLLQMAFHVLDSHSIHVHEYDHSLQPANCCQL